MKEANGAVKMAKINVDENQMIAGQMRVQSIPTVYAFYQGNRLMVSKAPCQVRKSKPLLIV